MGIKLHVITPHQIELPDAYISFDRFTHVNKSVTRAFGSIYKDKAAKDAKAPPIETETLIVEFMYDADDKTRSLQTQAYDALRLLDGFQNAEDVFEVANGV